MRSFILLMDERIHPLDKFIRSMDKFIQRADKAVYRLDELVRFVDGLVQRMEESVHQRDELAHRGKSVLKRKRLFEDFMANRYVYANYLPNSKPERRLWLANFNAVLPQYAAGFAITADEQARLANGLIWIDYALACRALADSFSKSLTDFSDEMDSDASENDAQEPQWTPPALPKVPGRTGTFNFVVSLVADKILSAKPSPQVLTALGLNPLVIVSNVSPEISALVAHPAGNIDLSFSKGRAKQVIIEGKRGAGEFELLKEVVGTHWTDTRPNAVAGQSESRTYRTRFSDGQDAFGDYSPERTVSTQA